MTARSSTNTNQTQTGENFPKLQFFFQILIISPRNRLGLRKILERKDAAGQRRDASQS